MNEDDGQPLTPQSMLDEFERIQWLHDHKSFKFITPGGVEYVARVAKSPGDEMIEELTPGLPERLRMSCFEELLKLRLAWYAGDNNYPEYADTEKMILKQLLTAEQKEQFGKFVNGRYGPFD